MKNNNHANSRANIFRQLLLALSFFVVATTVLAQNRTISGTIVDSRGESLIGASVLEKGTSNGTITDIDGKFSLSATANAILQISYIGYISQEIKAETGKTMRIILLEDSQTLDEVVVVGFGTQKKVNLTGSVGLADAKDLDSQRFSDK